MTKVTRPARRLAALLVAASVSLHGGAALARSAGWDALVSIAGIRLAKDEAITGLALATGNLRVLAVCHIPLGWNLSLSGAEGSAGTIEAAAGGAAALGHGALRGLHAIFLVRRSYAAAAEVAGTIKVVTPGRPSEIVERPLAPSNIVTRPADRCPPPRAWMEPETRN